jgi:hypothetical protein
MLIIFKLFLVCMACFFMGWGIKNFLVGSDKEAPVGITMAIGYAFGGVAFFISYFLFHNSGIASKVVFYIAASINVLSFYRFCKKDGQARVVLERNCLYFAIPCLIFVVVTSVALLPYINSGYNKYWHTANEDIFDGINGMAAYLDDDPYLYERENIDVSVRTRNAFEQSLKDALSMEPKHDAKFFDNRYFAEIGMLQYSNLAFFAIFTNSPLGMDAFLLQAIFNLGLFSIGVYACVITVFQQTKIAAIIAACMTTLGTFYFATYLNGHEGSLIYNSIIPFLLYVVLNLIQRQKISWRFVFLAILFVIFICGVYPYPLPYIFAPIILYFLLSWCCSQTEDFILKRISFLYRVLLLVIISGLLFGVIYFVAEPIRSKALFRFRSWGTIVNHVGFLQFWGIWPSCLAYTQTALSWLNDKLLIKLMSFIFAVVITTSGLYGVYSLVCKRNLFVVAWVTLFALFFIIMYFAVCDSYYVYKFLYINSWFVYVFAIVGLLRLMQINRISFKIIAFVILVLWFGCNIINNGMALYEITNKSFNIHFEQYRDIIKAPKKLLEQSLISIAQNDHADLVREILSENGIVIGSYKAHARYLLVEKGIKDVLYEAVGQLVWQSARFKLIKIVSHDVPDFASYWGAEGEVVQQPFRWVAEINKELKIDLYRPSGKIKYLFLCGESGPGVGYKDVSVIVKDASNNLVGKFIVGQYGCQTMPINNNYTLPFTLTHNERGKINSYVDPRFLIYKVMHIGFLETNSIPQEFYLDNKTKDIIEKQRGAMLPEIYLGNNWYAYESFDGDSFRWARPAAEILISGKGRVGNIILDVSPGPSAGKQNFSINLIDENAKVLGVCKIDGRTICTYPVREIGNGIAKLTLISDAENLPVQGDSRILNYRVFSLSWQQFNLGQ